MFTWIPIHREAIHRILGHRHNEKELLAILHEMEERGLKVISIGDKDVNGQTIPLAEIDPFTFLASFNRRVTDKNRRDNWRFLKTRWNLEAPVPDDFTGIPVLHNMSSWLFPYAGERKRDHVADLWQLAALAVDGGIEKVDKDLLDRCLKLKKVGLAILTIGMFWINPERFLPADHRTKAFGRAKGITVEPEDYQSYRQWLKEMTELAGNNYPQVSHEAYLFATGHNAPANQTKGWKFTRWMGPIVEALRTLGGSAPASSVLQKIQELTSVPDNILSEKLASGQSRFYNETHWARQYLVWEGLIESSERGTWALTAKGQDVILDGQRAQKIAEKWAKRYKQEGEIDSNEGAEPTIRGLAQGFPLDVVSRRYWTFAPGADGKHWEEFYAAGIIAIGWDEASDLHDFKSQEEIRQKLLQLQPNETSKKHDSLALWQFAHEIQKGDIVFAKQGFTKLLGYGIVEGDYVFDTERPHHKHVRKVKWLAKGEWEMPEDNKMAPKALTDITSKSDVIKLIASKVGLEMGAKPKPANTIDYAQQPPKIEIESYDKKKAMKGLFLEEAQFDEMLTALKEKKNVVLQGAPGVGKTYVAKRLAYALIGSNDPQRIEMIQFHQSYSYEDFIQGFRPTPKGHFDLKWGIFHQFCRQAQREEAQGKPCVFIIDEINRGNLSKIFGELMMLIEPDKRGKEHGIPLAYSQDADEKFHIPENLHLIGMMNTADRSLAMVDYALRRRFRFITLRPEFSSEVFRAFLVEAGATLELVKKIVARMNTLNEVITADTKNLGPGYQIGHSYFCPRNGINPDGDWYRRVIESEIVPLIQEYWFDNEQKVKDQRSALLA